MLLPPRPAPLGERYSQPSRPAFNPVESLPGPVVPDSVPAPTAEAAASQLALDVG